MATNLPSQTEVTYGFRLKIHLPPGRVFAHVHRRRRLKLDDIQGKVYLVRTIQQKRNKFGARERYSIKGAEFPTYEIAEQTGRRIQLALSLIAAERRFGLDCQDRQGASFSQAIKDVLVGKHGVQLRDNVHGLDIYSEEKPVTYFEVEAFGSVIQKIEDYEERLASFFRANVTLSQKQRLALDLYNLSHFEGTNKTRFLTLITVIEVLSVRIKRSASVQELLKRFKAETIDSKLKPEELNSLSNALSSLTTQSIGEACRQFVMEYAPTDVIYFKNCYKARSELVHDGVTNRPEAFDTPRLDELVSHLIIRSLTGDT